MAYRRVVIGSDGIRSDPPRNAEVQYVEQTDPRVDGLLREVARLKAVAEKSEKLAAEVKVLTKQLDAALDGQERINELLPPPYPG